jgi:mono/diheme cytochrome c family protein
MIRWRLTSCAVVVAFAAGLAVQARAQTKLAGDVQAGRDLALLACTSCHVVTADQPFKPIYSGTPRPPDFKDIANKPNVTAQSLIHYLATLPTIPPDSRMANPDLTSDQLRDVAAFIVTLRDKPAAATR